MERWVIEADSRHTVRCMKTAMQGNVIRALVELITNSDDSYIKLEDAIKTQQKRIIEVLYKKQGRCGFFTVRDYAEGMSIDNIREGFKKYGASTSGMSTENRIRGYFGQGAKDALCSMIDGRICTFKGDQFTECRFFIEGGEPICEIIQTGPASASLRRTHKINGNGTVVYFKADPEQTVRTPQFSSVQEDLANNYLLRKIMTNSRRQTILCDENTEERRPLKYTTPANSKDILSEDFEISYGGYGKFPIHISIWRAETELTQAGDDRQGGLLLVDDKDTVLEISLFKYDNEPLAAHFWGEVRVGRFRELLKNEEAVLSEERDGLVMRHPFCQALVSELEKRIDGAVKEEKLRKQKESQSKIDREENTRYKKAFNILNEIAEREAQVEVNLGENLSNQPKELPNGFCLYPSSAQITVGKRYAFVLRLNTKVIPYRTKIQVDCTNTKIRILTHEIQIKPEDGKGILNKYITVEGTEPNIEGILSVTIGNNSSKSKVYVVPEKEWLLNDGMVFQPESLTLRPNHPRTVYLLVYTKMIEGGSKVQVSSDNESVHISPNEVVVNEANAMRNVAKYEFEIWGDGVGQEGYIKAECGAYLTYLHVRIKSKEESEQRNRNGMFSEPEYNFETEPLQRTSYSPETGRVIIYVNFPSISHYLGQDCCYKKTLPAQVLIADLVAEQCFYEIAKKQIESREALIRAEGIADAIKSSAYDFSRRYGKKIHEILVDQDLVKQTKVFIETNDFFSP